MNAHVFPGWAVIGIFLILLVDGLVTGSNFLIPVTTAVLGYFVLSRPRRRLEDMGVPNAVTALGFTLLIVLVVTVTLVTFSSPVSNLIRDLPELLTNLQRELALLRNPTLDAVSEAANAIDEMVDTKKDEGMKVEVVADEDTTRQILTLAPRLFSQIVFAILLLFFLLNSGDFFLARAADSLSRTRDRALILEIFNTIETRLGRYLGGITLINLGLGVTVGAIMFALGIERYMAIGAMAFALNYIPYLGGFIGSCIAALLASAQFGDLWMPFLAFAGYMICTSVEGQVITPLLISRRMQLNAPVLFLVVAFFAYIWSIIGMIVAVPILIVAKIICDEIEPLRHLGRFIGDSPKPEKPVPLQVD